MLHTQHAALGSLRMAGGSHFLSSLRLRMCRSRPVPTSQFFCSSSPARAKRQTKAKMPNTHPTLRTSPPPIKPRSSPVTGAAAGSLPRPASAAVAAAANSASTPGASRSLADQFGRRSVPTLLYEAPSHLWYRVTTLGAGLFCIGYTTINYWSVFVRPPPDLVWWVPQAFGVICVVMVGAGIYLIMGGNRIVRVIQAMPASRIEALAGKGAASTAARAAKEAGGAPTPVFLEIEIGRVFPILPPRKLYVVPSAVVIPSRLATYGLTSDNGGASAAGSAAAVPLTGYKRVMAHRAEQDQRNKNREYEMSHLMTAPFRHAGQGAQTVFKQIQRAFSRDGFVTVTVDGRSHRLDTSGGWALENGRALDRLVTVTDNS